MQSAALDNTDRLLNELEDTARSNACDAHFYQRLLDCLRLIVSAESAGYVTALPPQGNVLVASSGKVPSQIAAGKNPLSQSATLEADTVFVVPVQSESSEDYIFVTFHDAIPASGRPALQAIFKAFLEILSIRWMQRFESLERSRNEVELLLRQIPKTTNVDEAATLIAEQMAHIVSAVRVSLIAHKLHARGKLLAINSCPDVDRKSALVQAIVALGQQAIEQGNAILDTDSKSNDATQMVVDTAHANGVLSHRIALPLCGRSSRQGLPTSMVLEWGDRETMMTALPVLKRFYTQLSATWLMQSRWLGLPALLRWANLGGSSLTRPIFRWTLGGIVGIVTVWVLTRPVDLIVESQATLDPVSKSTLFASADSYLQSLYVNDGQSVTKGMALVSLRSPTLDLQIEETIGQLRAVAEKRASLRVALNQSSQSSNEAEVNRTRISSDLVVLESQEKHIQDKLAFLKAEQEQLTLRSPMDGIVVARDLQRELGSRPLRRGDPLFQIVDTTGVWQLRMQIADRDAGYVASEIARGEVAIEFQLESRPGQFFEGKVSDVANAMESTAAGEVLVAFATIDNRASEHAFMGASAKAYVRCGRQPVWFVWCRPWVESIQKKSWLFPFHDNASQD